jgi:hypothetical protein
MELMIEFRKRAREIALTGGVILKKTNFELIAEKAALPKKILPKIMDWWTRDGDDAPAFLNQIEKDRYTLGDAYHTARDFIISAGKKEISASKSGKKTKKKYPFSKKRQL